MNVAVSAWDISQDISGWAFCLAFLAPFVPAFLGSGKRRHEQKTPPARTGRNRNSNSNSRKAKK